MRIASNFFICSYTALLFTACSKGGGSSPVDTLPVVTINSLSQDRTLTTSNFHFTVSLDKAATSDAIVHYATLPATAEENKDYKPVSGSLTIAAGQKQASFDVEVTGDSIRKENQFFYVQLSDPKNCKLGAAAKGSGNILNENGLYFPVDNTGYSTPDSYPGYTLTWSDEFNGNSINSADWTFEQGNNNGWGNAELENYTNRTQNAFVSSGNLVIEARKETYQTSDYTSARMITKNKKIFTYGRVDIRAKLPKGKGVWPALWMLGNNIDAVNWPACGEIDIMELLGQEPNKMYGTLHWGADYTVHQSKGNNYVLSSGSFDEQFHVYSMEWKQDTIKLYVDDVQYLTVTKTDLTGSDYPFNKDFFFIFNIAVGGNWPGSPDSNTSFPQRMVVDYVRVFQ
ncbi:family 16 glycosylhydrolase [Panacibacter ginsenosidivorans]|uniref:Family 16 glycosylhydrolase n=1 Tax=Panacibacter ginsenosidivorans TaxID=1813871 RepID=A0A5B8VAX9_9BACT|nr:family 16 glycosylhydrolase [Panacibacter ginsenosidivorans]QEC68512.1 family 16 glycosylhydrolase [Panacibacter ginsenosidivorans]